MKGESKMADPSRLRKPGSSLAQKIVHRLSTVMSTNTASDADSRLNFLPNIVLQNLPSFLFGSKKMGSKTPDGTLESNMGTIPRFYCPYQSLPSKKRPKRGELIELANFGVVEIENIEKQGVGHEFLTTQPDHPAWCDRCGDLIWGVGQLVQCSHCKFTCHIGCLEFITVDCQPQQPLAPVIEKCDNRPTSPLQIEGLTTEDLLHLINQHNRRFPDLEMNLSPDGVVTGFVRVCMNLMRPINVISGTRPPSIYDVLSKEDTLEQNKTLTSFYLPMDTMKALHVDSLMTAQNVIIALLKKFKVADSPLKYALYESYMEGERLKLRKLDDDERPLVLSLGWSDKGIVRQFVLQENDSGDIKWDMFALPELDNFLKILDMEEAEYLRQIKAKYEATQKLITHLIETKTPRSPTHEDDRYY